MRRTGLLTAAVTLLIAGLATGSVGPRDGEADAAVPYGQVGVPATVAEPTAGPAVQPSEHPAVSPRPLAAVTVRYDLDEGLVAPIWDTARLLALHPSGVRRGHVRPVVRQAGLAAAYPRPCVRIPSECPRVILESDPAQWLNPGARDLRWGALVRLRREQTSDGENIVQKGRSTAGTQFKLQVDHTAGLPSCVVAGPVLGVNRIFIAQYAKTVADGRWHSLDCWRTSGTLTLSVDGMAARQVAVPTDLAIVNDEPLRLGGKGILPGNDQFHGTLDSVYVTIG